MAHEERSRHASQALRAKHREPHQKANPQGTSHRWANTPSPGRIGSSCIWQSHAGNTQNQFKRKTMSIANVKQFKCDYCGDDADGRTDQKFCSADCRSGFNNRKTAANRKLAELVNTRAIAYAQNVQLLNQLILDGRLGPYTLDALMSLGYCADSPYDKRISDEHCQVTLYGNVRLKRDIGMDRYELSVERSGKKMQRRTL